MKNIDYRFTLEVYLDDKCSKHFPHPIPNVIGDIPIRLMVQMPDSVLRSIRGFGKKSVNKLDNFRAIYKKATSNSI